MIRISEHLLIHSATLKTNIVEDDWGKEISSDSVELTKVRYSQTDKIIKTKTNEELMLSAFLWYDTTNSMPSGITFSHGQEITFDGKIHHIETIKSLYDDSGFGHYKLGLI